MEEWKQICQSQYEVSTLGNVSNGKRMNILKPRCSTKGRKREYICYEVNLDLNGVGQRNYKIHQLVARAFIPNPDNRTEIDHIDRNTANNAVSNLRWATRSEQNLNQETRSDNKLGEKNIHFRKNVAKPYFVSGVKFKQTFFFATLEEAVAYRNSILNP